MPAIICFAHQKGGVGKTTLVLNMFQYFSREVSCAVLDTDPQGSIATLYNSLSEESENWADLEIIDNDYFESSYNYEDLRKLENFDIILIDTPPYLSERLKSIFDNADLVIIPSRASTMDAAAIGATVDLVKAAQESNRGLKAGIALNAVKKSTHFTRDIRGLFESKYNIKVFENEIVDRVAYARGLLTSPYVDKETDPNAYQEIQKLGEEVLAYISEQ